MTFNVVIIILFIFALNFINILGQENVNSGLKNGDECTFNETTKGVCTKMNKCDYITENAEFSKQIPDEIKKSLCLSRERHQLVCCPSLFKPQEINTRLETKFDKATCIGIEPQLELNSNIVGGQQAEVDEFKFQATIGYKAYGSKTNETNYLCAGSLIAEDIVITSAYCLRLRGFKLSVVKLGAVSCLIMI